MRPTNKRRDADAAKALLTIPDGDHLTLMNVYNQYLKSKSNFPFCLMVISHAGAIDKRDKNWAWTNFLSFRALQQAEDIRKQLKRTMERFDIDLVSLENQKDLYTNIRKALVAGFFMQVGHMDGRTGHYITKDNEVGRSRPNYLRDPPLTE